jgi:hypothetical protein
MIIIFSIFRRWERASVFWFIFGIVLFLRVDSVLQGGEKTITFGAGQETVVISVLPINDGIPDDWESVSMAIAPHENYGISGRASAELWIQPKRTIDVVTGIPPKLLGFSPSRGGLDVPVTFVGEGFTEVTQVTFAGTPAAFEVVDDSHISTRVPAGAISGPIRVLSPLGIATSLFDFTALFKDVVSPALNWEKPLSGTTGLEKIQIKGSLTDNVGIVSSQWSMNGKDFLNLALNTNGIFSIDNLILSVGTNTFSILARDATGNKVQATRQVVWEPQRTLIVDNGPTVQEGQRLTFPIKITSSGDVAGLSFRLLYPSTFLTDPKLEWSATVGQSVNNLNVSLVGEIASSFALAGTTLMAGTQSIATVSFRTRSVPMATNVILKPFIVSFSDGSGTALSLGNAEVSGEGRITPRRIIGDNNANQRIDIGDATVISRLQVGLEERRAWDVGLNDLNNTKDLDIGDTVKALRIVVGMDAQPSPLVEAKRLSTALASNSAPMSTNYSAELALLDGPTIQHGSTYRVAVKLKGNRGNLTGLSFSLKYPASLELNEKAISAGVPIDALPAWNVSESRAKLALIRAKAWAAPSGTVAVLTFEPRPESGMVDKLAISLEEVEVADLVEGLTAMPSVWLDISGGLNSVPRLSLVSKSDSKFVLEVRGPQGLNLALEASGDLSTWFEVQRVNGQGDSIPSKITLNLDTSVQAQFWRVRVR